MKPDPNRVKFLAMIEKKERIGERFHGMRRLDANGGGGTFSLLCEAEDEQQGNAKVALKFLYPFERDAYRRECFEREAVVLERLKGQRDIIQLVAGRDEFICVLDPLEIPFVYYAVEIAATDLNALIEDKAIDAHLALLHFRAMCRAVRRIHSLRIAHRDIKPANFLVMSDGSIRLGKAIAIAPRESPIPYNNLARVWFRKGETRRAFDIAKHAQTQFGNNPDTMCVLASCLERVGLYDEAIAQIEPIVKSGKATASICAQLGGLLTEGGHDQEAALTFLKEAFKKFKANEIVANNLAYAYLLMGDAESARPIIEKCLQKLESHWMQPLHTICLTATHGLLRIIEGDLEEGIRLYRKAEKLCPQLGYKEFANTVIQKMHLELARAYFRKHEYQHAKEEVRKGLAVRDGKLIYQQNLLTLGKQLPSMGGERHGD